MCSVVFTAQPIRWQSADTCVHLLTTIPVLVDGFLLIYAAHVLYSKAKYRLFCHHFLRLNIRL